MRHRSRHRDSRNSPAAPSALPCPAALNSLLSTARQWPAPHIRQCTLRGGWGQQREGGGDGGGGAPERGHDQVVVEGRESHEVALADKGSLSSACDGKEGGRSGRRGASMLEAWASEVGGACSGGLLRERTRAADLFPSPAVSSATGTRRNRAGVHGKDASGMGSALHSLLLLIFGVIILLFFPSKNRLALRQIVIGDVVVDIRSDHIVVASQCCCCSELLQSLLVKAASVHLLAHA